MRRNRTGLLLAAIVPLVLSAPLAAQVAPTLSGQTGLFDLTNHETIPAGHFSFSLFYDNQLLPSAPSLVYESAPDDPIRYRRSKIGLTIGYGLTSKLEGSIQSGSVGYDASNRFWSGVIGGHERTGEIDHNETDKVRIGLKYLLNDRSPDQVKVAVFGGVSIPTQTRSDAGALGTYRADWDFGTSFTYGIATVQVAYLLSGDLGNDFDIANELTFGLGLNFQLVPKTLRFIPEIKRVHFDGGTTKPIDYWAALAGVRWNVADTGLTLGAALRANIDTWTKYGSSPNGLGGLVQISWMPQPSGAAPAAMVPARPGEPEPAPASMAPAPAPAANAPVPAPVTEPAPAPRAETSTTDEILFDAAKSRLTNIAKAILDGVALRLKNNLSATCTVASHTDPKEKGGDHVALAKARAEAAKDYLVKRHGIDAGRIKTEVKGDAEAGTDAIRNRRAVVTVTFP